MTNWRDGVHKILGKWNITNNVSANYGLAADEIIDLIQALLDKKTEEIEKLRKKTFCPWKHSADDVDDVMMCEGCQGARKALDQAVSILKEEE